MEHSSELRPGAFWRFSGRLFCGGDPDALPEPGAFTVADGVAGMERARDLLHDLTAGRASDPVWAHAIGGFVCHATVLRDGEPEFTVPHTWPDVIGEKIKPVAAPMAEAA